MNTKKVCFITAIYGNYETSCKKMVNQTIPTDFICFTDNKDIIHNNWKIDTTPYHIINKSKIDNDNYTNSIYNNKHTFNIAKYYKQAFQNIPILKKYDVIIWIDGTVEIIYEKTSEYILKNIYKYKIIGWHHEYRQGILKREVDASKSFYRYNSAFWNNQIQPYQYVEKQYDDYLNDGYDESFFKKMYSHTSHFGVWITCFVAFLNNDDKTSQFLNMWYLQTLQYTTQDQISFPYVCQKTNIIPYTLPNYEIKGYYPHDYTLFYIKHIHG
jgi:hypothetical protein